MKRWQCMLILSVSGLLGGCQNREDAATNRASGYVEATEVRLASRVSGRVTQVNVNEGARVSAGDVAVVLSPADIDVALRRAQAERAAADAQLRLLRAGTRIGDVRQAEAQQRAAVAEQAAAASELAAATTEATRFEQLLASRAGSAKQRDDAVARKDLAAARVRSAADRVAAADAVVDNLKAGARKEEVDAALARVAVVDASIAALERDRTETTILVSTPGTVTARLVEPGELVAAGAPVAVIVDVDHAWVNAYVEESLVPALRLDSTATVHTDAGDELAGRVAFISPRAEFTPRNVQTAAERAKLVYRVKVAVDNRTGVLKPGMPVEVEFR